VEGDSFRARLDQIINLKHELVHLGARIDWDWIDREIAPLCSDKSRPGIETRFVIGPLLLKQVYGLSDEGVCERWVYDSYFQHSQALSFSSTSSCTGVPTLATGASGSATNESFCWPRV
jgi:IS5 family transposase